MRAVDARLAVQRHDQRGGAPPERLVCQLAGHDATDLLPPTARQAPFSCAVSPATRSGQHRPAGLEAHDGGEQAELVEAAEHGHVRRGTSSAPLASNMPGSSGRAVVRTPIIGRPRRSHADASRRPGRTLICEAPLPLRRLPSTLHHRPPGPPGCWPPPPDRIPGPARGLHACRQRFRW